MIWPYLCVIPAYLLGTFPSAVFVARLAGHDVYSAGSGNPGASNVARIAGWKWGVLTMALDVLKGFVPTLIALLVFDEYLSDEGTRAAAFLLGAAAVMGHVMPIKRKGGKGIATSAGVALALFPLAAVVAIVVWAISMKLTKLPVVSSLLAGGLLTVWVGFDDTYTWEFVVIALLYAVIVIRHIPNIRRLMNGNESAVTKEARYQYQEKQPGDEE